LDEYAQRSDLTLRDVVALAHQATENYSDDLPGVRCVQRPSLQTFLRKSLDVGEESAGVGLRYGDFRDPGYVASVRVDERPEVDGIHHFGVSSLNYVMFNLASAADCLGSDAGHSPDTN